MKKARFLFCLAAVLLLLCGCSKYSGNYDKGLKAFEKEDFAAAAEIFDNCDPAVGNAPMYAAYCHGLVLWEKGMYTEAKPYFEETRGFMYASKRYKYCSAYELLEKGNYTEAAEMFLSLEDFENAGAQYQYCIGCEAENHKDYSAALAAFDSAGTVNDAEDRLLNLQTQIYSKAIELMNAGNYADALTLFNTLGDYLSAEEYAVQCRDIDRDALYEQAESALASGDTQEAYRLFTSLGSYRDATARATELADKLGIVIVDDTKPQY